MGTFSFSFRKHLLSITKGMIYGSNVGVLQVKVSAVEFLSQKKYQQTIDSKMKEERVYWDSYIFLNNK